MSKSVAVSDREISPLSTSQHPPASSYAPHPCSSPNSSCAHFTAAQAGVGPAAAATGLGLQSVIFHFQEDESFSSGILLFQSMWFTL